MSTMASRKNNIEDGVYNIIELGYEIIQAYDIAIDRLEGSEHIDKLKKFKSEHEQCLYKLKEAMEQHHIKVPKSGGFKQWLTKGKVIIGNIVGEKAVIRAALSNEADINSAYEKLIARQDVWQEIQDVIRQEYEKGKQREAWLEAELAK